MKSSIFFLFTFYIILSITQIFAFQTNSRCLLGKDGKEICEPNGFEAVLPVRMGEPCSQDDMNCWNILAVKYTNDIRRRNGKTKSLNVAPDNQLKNAIHHSEEMAKRNSLDHQKLRDVTREISCKLFANAENIAYTSRSNGDIAKTCVDMWEGSSGHLKNILLDSSENCAIGFYIDNRGLLWCTQTFSLLSEFETFGNPNGPGCKPAGKPAGKMTEIKKPMSISSGEEDNSSRDEGNSSRDEGNRSCRCLEVGRQCWASLEGKSGNRCKRYTSAFRQPSACRQACCDYCAKYKSSPLCRSRNVMSICRFSAFDA